MSTELRMQAMLHGISVSRNTTTGEVEPIEQTLKRIEALYNFISVDAASPEVSAQSALAFGVAFDGLDKRVKNIETTLEAAGVHL